MLSAISAGASGSWQMDNRARTMLDRHFDHGFALDWMRKDLGIVFDEAQRIGATLPVTAMVDQFYARHQRPDRAPSRRLTLVSPIELVGVDCSDSDRRPRFGPSAGSGGTVRWQVLTPPPWCGATRGAGRCSR